MSDANVQTSEHRSCMTAQECKAMHKFAGAQTNDLRGLRQVVENFIRVRGVDGQAEAEERAFQEMCMTIAEMDVKDTADA